MYLMLAAKYLWDLYGSSIAVTNRSLDHSLSTRLIPSGALRGWCAVRTLQMYFSNRFLEYYHSLSLILFISGKHLDAFFPV